MYKIILLFLSLTAFAGNDFHYWDKNLADLQLDMNPLELRNRAGCAKDSLLPTKSAFLMLDNTTAAKAAYRLAKVTGQDSDVVTKELIKSFRLKVLNLTERIHHKLMTRQLPILPVIKSSNHIPGKYKAIAQSCFEQRECAKLDTYMEKLWANSERSESPVSKIIKNYEIDNFHSEENYFNQKKVNGNNRLTCFKLKKFSPLQAHLFGTKPDREVLQKMAESLKDADQFVGECTADEPTNLKVSGYQFDIQGVNEKYWNKKIGFDYWNSVKLYLAWAFQNVKVVKPTYERIIANSKAADTILFTSNGCKSIDTPECSNDYLAKNVLREMGKNDYKQRALELDVLSPIVEGAQDSLLDDPFTEVNTDIFDLARRENADDWIESLFNNFSKTKAFIKNKLVSSLSFYTIIDKKVGIHKLKNDLVSYYSKTGLKSNEIKNDLYYLCSEAAMVSHENFSFAKKHINLIKESGFIDTLDLIFHGQSLEALFEDYEIMMDSTREFCRSLDQKNIWDDSFSIDKSGYAQWYLDKVVGKGKLKSTSGEKLNALNKKPYLAYSSTGTTICESPSACIRKSISHILEVSRASYYASTFWNAKNKTKTSEMFNPYAERVACQVYDPFYKQKSVMTNFVSDLSQAAMSAFTPGVIYTKFNLRPGHVTSFNKMVKDGKILFDKKYKKQSVQMELVADFGPLLGVPCAVSVTGKKNYGYDAYHFAGISVGMCSHRDESQINVYSASEIDNLDADQGTGCFSCRLNFEAASSTMAYFNYKIGPIYYLVRSFVRLFKGFKDPHNIPRDWEINVRHLTNTYRRFGYIPKKCTKSLIKGRSCLGSSKEEKAVDYLQARYDVKIKAEKKRFNSMQFMVEGCSKPVTVRFSGRNNNDDFNDHGSRVSSVKVPNGCKLERK